MEEPLYQVIEGAQISSNDVAEAVQEPLRRIADAIRAVLAEAPAELVVDIRERGLVLSGGAAQLRGLAGFITSLTGIPSAVAQEPQTSVDRSISHTLHNLELIRRNKSYLREAARGSTELPVVV